MTVTTLQTSFKKLTAKRQDLAAQLESTRSDLAGLRAKMGAAILNGDDPDKLAADVVRLEAKEAGLNAALEVGELAKADQATQLEAAQLEADKAEFAKLQAELDRGAISLLKTLVAAAEELDRLYDLYVRTRALYRAHDGLPDTATPAAAIVAASRNTIKPLLGSMAQAFPDTLGKVGFIRPGYYR